jgi:hypothetical protein
MANPTGTINADEDHTGRTILKSDPTLNQDAATKKYVDDNAGGGGAAAFTDLSDVPGSYSGETQKVVRVNTGETGLEFVALSTLSSNIVSDAAYDAATWNGDTNHAPSKNAVRDKIESLGGGTVTNAGTLTSGQLVVGAGGASIDVGNLSGDVTTSGGTAATIAANAVTYGKIQAVSATSKLLGSSSTTTPVQEITLGTNLAMSGTTLNATAGGSGTVTTTGSPATGNLTKFSGATSITNGDLSGDVTTSGALATTIANNSVTLGKMATMATDSILGRATSSTGNVEVLTALPFAFTGDVTRPVDSNAQTIANSAVTYAKMQNVSANSVLLGSSASGSGAAPSEIALGTNLSMSGSTLNAASGGGTTVRVTGSNFTTSSTSLVDITGLTFAASANSVYGFSVYLGGQSSSTAGVQVNIHYNAAGATGSMTINGHTTSVAATGTFQILDTTTTNFWTTATTNLGIWCVGTIVTGANAGTISVQIKKNTSGSATVLIGSSLTIF